ncbi:uncharacterized protein (DUF1330 family)/uncharacterized protein YjiS (DUF1127 family) [Bradyrhizobium sp. USDA 4461]
MNLLRRIRRYIEFRNALGELSSMDQFTLQDLRIWPSEFEGLATEAAEARAEPNRSSRRHCEPDHSYILAQLKFTNRRAYDRYTARFMSVLKKFNGRLLIADENAELLAGSWPMDKVVLLSFPNREDAFRFHVSPEYEEIAQDRRAGAEATVLLLNGIS